MQWKLGCCADLYSKTMLGAMAALKKQETSAVSSCTAQAAVHCRLKDLLSQRLMECGWVEEVKERMQGQSMSHVGLSVFAAARLAAPGSPSSDWLSPLQGFCKACMGSEACMPEVLLAPFMPALREVLAPLQKCSRRGSSRASRLPAQIWCRQ